MAPKTKINLKDRFEDGELDLSLSELQEVPVREIAAMKKATSLDLSNNQLTSLGKNFVTLTHIIKLDLGKNLLTELPENFGEMKQLKHLDLYHNQLTHLPLSFYQLKNLRWLDLKDNPLVPAVAKIAGPCLDQQQCTQCAKNVVQFFTGMYEQIEEEKERREKVKQIELEIELANQKKQQKKKEKNKAAKAAKKSKNKAEQRKLETLSQQTQFIDYVKDPVTLNGHSNAPKHKKQSSFINKIFSFTVFFIITLFIFTTFKTNYANNVKQETIQIWSKFVTIMPEGLQPWCLTFSQFVGKLHNGTEKIVGNIARYFEDLNKNENVQIFMDFLKGTGNLIVAEGRKLFNVLGDQAIVVRNEIKRIFIEHF